MKQAPLPPGYKQTALGPIPEDWEIKNLSSLAEISTGKTPPTSNQNYYGNEFFFVSPTDLGSQKWVSDTEKKLSLQGFNISKKFPPNSILFTCIGSTIGKIGMAYKQLTTNQQINTILPNNSFHSDFLYYFLDLFAYKIKKNASETAVPIINKTSFGNTLIAIPPTLSEQTAIANALNDADALISELETLIAKKRLLKQGTMQQLLTGKKRLSGFTHHPDGRPKGYKPSPLGPIPEDWNIYKLSELANMKSGFSITSKNISADGKYPCFGGNGLRGYADQFTHSGRFALIGRQGALCGNVQFVSGDFFASEHAVVVTPKANTEIKLLYYVLVKMNLNQYSESSAQPGLSVAKILDLPLPYPASLAEQNAIATTVTDMEVEIIALESKLAKYKQIKQGMMQSLLTGKVRLL